MRIQSGMKMVCGLAILLGVAGLFGCSGDDEETAGTTTTVVVVTNRVNGTVATNAVEVPSADPAVEEVQDEADVQDEVAPAAILNVAGTWNGPVKAGQASNHLKLQLSQTGHTVNGQFLMNGVSGNANGSIQGDHLVVNLMFGISPWILDGHVNAGATKYTGNWNMNPDTGTFALQK